VGLINQLCSYILDIALTENLDSASGLKVVHIVLTIKLEDKLESDFGRWLELCLTYCQISGVYDGVQEIRWCLREDPESQICCLRDQVIFKERTHCRSNIQRERVLVQG